MLQIHADGATIVAFKVHPTYLVHPPSKVVIHLPVGSLGRLQRSCRISEPRLEGRHSGGLGGCTAAKQHREAGGRGNGEALKEASRIGRWCDLPGQPKAGSRAYRAHCQDKLTTTEQHSSNLPASHQTSQQAGRPPFAGTSAPACAQIWCTKRCRSAVLRACASASAASRPCGGSAHSDTKTQTALRRSSSNSVAQQPALGLARTL